MASDEIIQLSLAKIEAIEGRGRGAFGGGLASFQLREGFRCEVHPFRLVEASESGKPGLEYCGVIARLDW